MKSKFTCRIGRVERLEPRICLAADFRITEFMASNQGMVLDEDSDDSDWIEVANVGSTAESLAGWHLTDDEADLTKWQFPDVSLSPQERLVVWASDKDRTDPLSELHANYKLKAGGEYLALVREDGSTIASQFAPEYPDQFTNVSYGVSESQIISTLVGAATPVKTFVPTDDSLGTTWTSTGFAPGAAWADGPGMGVGYEESSRYEEWINTDIEGMYEVNGSSYIRAEFNYSAAPGDQLTLRIKYDDGFLAYLNGTEVVRRNAPADPTWNSNAASDRHDSIAEEDEIIDLTDSVDLLVDGVNMLAIHGLNVSTQSSDFLIDVRLEAATTSYGSIRYFSEPSPGESNAAASLNTAPFFSNVGHGGTMPTDGEDIHVTSTIILQGAALQSADLHYRVMYGGETTVPLLDNGLHGDGAAGDGVYGATIPHLASGPGEMVRYYVSGSSSDGSVSRFPFHADSESSEYEGTVIADPGVSSQLDVYHWFVQDPTWYDNGDGTHNYDYTSTSLFFDGTFYDNVRVRVKGKHSGQDHAPKFKFDLPPDNPFAYSPVESPVSKFDLASIYQDPSAARLTLGYEVSRETGSYASLAHPVHTRLNGLFYRLSIFVERVSSGTAFLERNGLGLNGALYKADGVYSGPWLQPGADIGTTAGMEKLNREEIDPSFADLVELINGVSPSNPARGDYLLDHVNIPEVVNTLAAYALLKHFDNATHNYYVYRDSDGNGLWSLLPWDLDTIWDRLEEPFYDRYFSGHPYAGSSSYPTWSSSHWNRLYDAVADTPVTGQMLLRRLRTLMDQILQPPGTPISARILETRVDALVDTLRPEATESRLKWGQEQGGSWGYFADLDAGVAHLKSKFEARRTYLYGLSIIPDPQPAQPNLAIGQIDAVPVSGNQKEEYIEIVNPHPVAIDISGWSIAGAVEHGFAPGTVIPAAGTLYAVRDLNAFRARTSGPGGGQGLVIQGDYQGGLSAAGERIELRNREGQLVAEYTYSATSDFNADGDVDGDDFLTWQRNAGMAVGAETSDGDANGDGAVNQQDLAIWNDAFGTIPSASAAASVPAPASAGLVAATLGPAVEAGESGSIGTLPAASLSPLHGEAAAMVFANLRPFAARGSALPATRFPEPQFAAEGQADSAESTVRFGNRHQRMQWNADSVSHPGANHRARRLVALERIFSELADPAREEQLFPVFPCLALSFRWS